MNKDASFTKELKQDELNGILTYLLAGLAGRTNGHEITGITVQQARLSGYRVVIRASGRKAGGDPIHVVGFTSAAGPGAALLIAEDGYARNVIQWKTDRFAKRISESGSSENGSDKLVLVD